VGVPSAGVWSSGAAAAHGPCHTSSQTKPIAISAPARVLFTNPL
jgi:hypothetical protein